jgi:PAS domain-containing protein
MNNPAGKKCIKKPLKDTLRKKSEEQLTRSQSPSTPDEYDAIKLLHEVEIHKVELLMQNDSLQEARDKAETALSQYANLYDFAPVGYLTLDQSGVISKLNIMAEYLLGVQNQKLLNQSIDSFVDEDSLPALKDVLDRLFKY